MADKPKDAWARQEAWRYEGPFTRRNRFKGSLPGLGTAVVAFALFNAYEYLFTDRFKGHGHGDAHGHSDSHDSHH